MLKWKKIPWINIFCNLRIDDSALMYFPILSKVIFSILNSQFLNFQFSKTIERGLSDDHMLVYIQCFKAKFVKLPPKIIRYRQYENFDQTNFLNEIYSKIGHLENLNCDNFILL